jgi:hypothetical protein
MKQIVFNSDNFVDQINFIGRVFEDKEYLFSKKYNPFLLNSKEISKCSRLLVCQKLYGKTISIEEKKRIIMDNFIKNIWIDLLSENENYIIMNRDICFNDSSINLSCSIDAIIRVGMEPFVFLFRYLNKKEFENVNQNGAIRKDIIDMICCLFLSQLHDGILIYHHKTPLVYHVKSSKEVSDSIIDKCNKINMFLINKNVPEKCRGYENKKCNNRCIKKV